MRHGDGEIEVEVARQGFVFIGLPHHFQVGMAFGCVIRDGVLYPLSQMGQFVLFQAADARVPVEQALQPGATALRQTVENEPHSRHRHFRQAYLRQAHLRWIGGNALAVNLTQDMLRQVLADRIRIAMADDHIRCLFHLLLGIRHCDRRADDAEHFDVWQVVTEGIGLGEVYADLRGEAFQCG